MNPWNDLRRAFAANPHQVPVGEREDAILAARGVEQPTLRIYFVWRRSLMVFVVLSTLLSAGVATYRDYTEPAEETDWAEELAGYLPLSAFEEDEDDGDDEEPAATSSPQPDTEPGEEIRREPQTAFARFTEGVELAALYALPIAALGAVLFWTQFAISFGIILAAFAFSFLVPMIIALCPWSWWGYVEPVVSEKTQPLQFWQLKVEGLLEGAAYLVTLLPTVLSLIPGVQRACVRVKLLIPQSALPGFFLAAASPFYALFLLVIFVAINQFDTHPLFFAGMLIFLAAPLTYAATSNLVTRPLATEDDFRKLKLVQRFVGLMTAVAGGLIVAYLTTRDFRGIHLLGFDYEKSLLVPLDVVEFLLEVLSRSMFVTVLGADLFMRMNLKAWQHERAFRGKPEAADYDAVMSEFQRIG